MVWEALLFLEGEVSTGNPDLGPPSEHQAYLRQLQYVLLLVFHLLTPISSLPCPALPLCLWLGFSQWHWQEQRSVFHSPPLLLPA